MLLSRLGLSPNAGAAEATLRQESSDSRFWASAETGYATIKSSNGAQVSALAAGIGANFAVLDRLAVGLGVRQSFSPQSSFSAYYTAFDVKATYALTGAPLVLSRESVTMDSESVLEGKTANEGGFRLQLGLAQYYLNSSSGAVPFSGIGAQAHYEFPSESKLNYLIGIKYDQVGNGKLTLSPIQLLGGIVLWL